MNDQTVKEPSKARKRGIWIDKKTPKSSAEVMWNSVGIVPSTEWETNDGPVGELDEVINIRVPEELPDDPGDSFGGSGSKETFDQTSSDYDEFLDDEDYINYYLREVANYPLLTAEREIELAKTIRWGQDALVELVETSVARIPALEELNQKVRKLIKQEKKFPGVRDKIIRLIQRTAKKLAQEHPEKQTHQEILREVQAISKRIEAAKEEMVKSNLRLVLSIAKRYRARGMSFADLIQEGNLGLLKAVSRYDHTKGNRFSTYATWWVRQSIIRSIYDKTRTIRLPVHFIEQRNTFHKVFQELTTELGREPTAEEIARRTHMPVEKVEMIMGMMSSPISLETPIGDDEQRLGDFIEDESAESPFDECTTKELETITRDLLASLKPREEKILRLRFGFNGKPEETLESIGRTFNVSKERIRQIEKKALNKLRHTQRRELLRTFLD